MQWGGERALLREHSEGRTWFYVMSTEIFQGNFN